MLVQVYLLCLLGVDGSIMVADGKVRPCFHWFWEAYATLEGLLFFHQTIPFCKIKRLRILLVYILVVKLQLFLSRNYINNEFDLLVYNG